ncbi:trypsin-like serine peptidase [Stenotrophomonas sp. NPDC077464]|uniref:trypsin-like serine peptidase n=1 Tax=unclassified Stenotrophomonas TaxID=196198 RepID=UPI0037CFE886
MSGPFNEDLSGRLETAGARAFRLLNGGDVRKAGGALESGALVAGAPDTLDARRISTALFNSMLTETTPIMGRDREQEALDIGVAMTKRAMSVLTRMKLDGPRTPLTISDAIALESVLMVRGRPSLRVQEEGIEPIESDRHPGAEMWRAVLTTCERKLLLTSASVGAVMVQFVFSNLPPQVVGTAWVVGDGTRAITNRHVIFPPGGSALARRQAGGGARMRSHINVWVDFAHNGPGKAPYLRQVIHVDAATLDDDPIDAAVLQLETAGPAALRLQPAKLDDAELIYVVGHPGKMMRVPHDVASVFGNPDGEKRISFGEAMPADPNTPHDVVHDGSTIGGFSGGAMGNPLSDDDYILGLHYLGGSTASGNRALRAQHLLAHPLLAALV